jgi:hypothetical protein
VSKPSVDATWNQGPVEQIGARRCGDALRLVALPMLAGVAMAKVALLVALCLQASAIYYVPELRNLVLLLG